MTRVVSLVPISMAKQRLVEEREAAKRLARARRRLATLSKANERASEPSLTAAQQRAFADALGVLRRSGLTNNLPDDDFEALVLAASRLVCGQLRPADWSRLVSALAARRRAA